MVHGAPTTEASSPTLAMLYKICPNCGPLSRSEFYRNKARPDGLQSSCKKCHRAAVDRYRWHNRPAVLLARRHRYWKDPDTARDSARNWARENRPTLRDSEARYRAANPWKHRSKCAARRARMGNILGTNPPNAQNIPQLYVRSHRPMITGCFTGNIEDVYALAELMTKLLNEPYEVDHALRLADGGPHHKDNLDVLSRTENRRKG